LTGRGPANIASRVVGDALIPAIFSETAGTWAKGTAAEPWARVLGGLGGNLGVGAVRAHAGAADRAVINAAGQVTPAEHAQGAALGQRAQAFGVPLSGPEAIQAATNGGTKLGDLLRVVEHSPRGGDVLPRFFGARPGQVDEAVNR